jgi:hypothetical protein
MRPGCTASKQGQRDTLWNGIMHILLGKTGSLLYTASSKVMGTVFRDAPSVIHVYVNTEEFS